MKGQQAEIIRVSLGIKIGKLAITKIYGGIYLVAMGAARRLGVLLFSWCFFVCFLVIFLTWGGMLTFM